MLCLRPINGAALSYKSCRASTASSKVSMGSKRKTNFYKVLSLESENVGFDEIKKAYRSMALKYHPDVCPSNRKEESAEMFVELHQAYETLSDPSSRRAYDTEQLAGETDGASSSRARFSRGTWEAQLHELARRSEQRERARSGLGRDN